MKGRVVSEFKTFRFVRNRAYRRSGDGFDLKFENDEEVLEFIKFSRRERFLYLYESSFFC